MPTFHDNATTWRELADSLTPDQVAYLEHLESRPDEPPMADGTPHPPERHRAGLLFAAREMVGSNAAAALYADVPPPQEDGQHYEWRDAGDGSWSRFFVGTERKVGDGTVSIMGNQSSDGTIERSINVQHAEDMDAATARQLAAALVAAADEMEKLAHRGVSPGR